MKPKIRFWGMIGTGSLLVLLSAFLAFWDTSQSNVIGGADWPTFFSIYRRNYAIFTFYGVAVIVMALGRPWNNRTVKSTIMVLLPWLLFPGLRSIYQWFNRNFLVYWLGCGCPKKDEFGNLLECQFNANDFSCIFWFVAALGMGVFAFFIGRKLFTKRKWLTALYIVAILSLALIIFRNYCLQMWWN